MKEIDIYTDGACSNNPGKGGWGAVLMYKSAYKEISGFEISTTNNRMELLAVIRGLSLLKETCIVNIFSDSAYVVNAFNNGWLANWKRNNWKKTINATEQIKNVDLWIELDHVASKHNVTFNKVKGHSDNVYNNRCDELATSAITNNSIEE